MQRIDDIDAGTVRLAAYAAGPAHAPPVLLVHGYPDNAQVWSGVARHLARDFRVYAYDVRGAGHSTRPRHVHAYRLPHLADDLRAVCDALSPGRPVHLVGHDWGSIQSWEAVTADDATQRIASFTSISGPCLDHIGHWLRRAPRPAAARQALKSWYVGLFQLPAVGELLWTLGGARTWRAALKHVEGITAPPRSPTQVDDGMAGMALYRANVGARLRQPEPLRTDLPVHVIELARDHFVSPALLDDLAHWAPRLTRSRLDAGHWAPISHPAALGRMIGTWVADQTRAAGGPAVSSACETEER